MFTARYGLGLYVRNYSKQFLKKGHASSPVLFNFVLEYTIRRVQANHEGLKVNGTLQLLIYVGDVSTVIPRLTKIIRFGTTFVSRNVISRRFL